MRGTVPSNPGVAGAMVRLTTKTSTLDLGDQPLVTPPVKKRKQPSEPSSGEVPTNSTENSPPDAARSFLGYQTSWYRIMFVKKLLGSKSCACDSSPMPLLYTLSLGFPELSLE